MQQMTPCLWFDSNAEEAARFYLSVFKNSRITHIGHYSEAMAKAGGRPVGSVAFELDGQPYLAINGGPAFQLTPAISFIINCETQQDIDTLWDRLSEGGQPMDCGWVTDRFGVTWQIAPASLGRMMQDEDKARAERVAVAMLGMKKLDLAALEAAYGQN
jgi:predicted 3-demethylubiquinone-9 3-methyltransferase (glyoxalase superfamily)